MTAQKESPELEAMTYKICRSPKRRGGYDIEVSDDKRRWLAEVTPTDDDGQLVHVFGLHDFPPQMIEVEYLTHSSGWWWTPRDFGPDDVAREVVHWLRVTRGLVPCGPAVR